MGQGMTFRDLVDCVEHFKNSGHIEDDAPLLITLEEKSVGGRSATQIGAIYPGFDWEQGQLRVQPVEALVRNGNAFSDPQAIIHRYSYDGERKIYACPHCDSKISKEDRFCRYCGKKLSGKIYESDWKPKGIK